MKPLKMYRTIHRHFELALVSFFFKSIKNCLRNEGSNIVVHAKKKTLSKRPGIEQE